MTRVSKSRRRHQVQEHGVLCVLTTLFFVLTFPSLGSLNWHTAYCLGTASLMIDTEGWLLCIEGMEGTHHVLTGSSVGGTVWKIVCGWSEISGLMIILLKCPFLVNKRLGKHQRKTPQVSNYYQHCKKAKCFFFFLEWLQ